MNSPASLSSRRDRWGPWLFALVALAPLVANGSRFRDLFWFGDDWSMLDQWNRAGFWRWLNQMFTEDYVPLFKVVWGALVVGSSGSYFTMIVALWLTHALNVALFGKLLRQEGFGWIATALTLAVFGLASGNVESLAWSAVLTGLLSATFLLGAALWFGRSGAPAARLSGRGYAGLCALILAGALCFPRGVLISFALAAVCFLPWREARSNLGPRLRAAAACLPPGIVVSLLIFVYAGGNHRQLAGGHVPLGAAAQFGAWYLSLSPLYRLLPIDSWGWRTTLILGALKLALVVWALARSGGRTRRLLFVLLLVDLGNAVLLGIGRYHTGLPASIGSRYQYYALICTLPFIGFWVETMLRSWTGARAGLRTAIALALVAGAGAWVARDWGAVSEWFAAGRGRNTRYILFEDAHPPAMGAIPGIPFLATDRAQELVRHYHLH